MARAGHPVDRQGRAANHRFYRDGTRVRDYVVDDYHRIRRAEAVRLLRAALPHADRPVLEIGSGSAAMLAGVAEPPWPVVTADLAHEALRNGGCGRAGAVCLDATRPFPLCDDALDGIVMGELIEHVFDPLALLRECHRALAPGGVLVLTTPNLATLQDRARFLLGHSPRHVNPLHPYLSLHIRPFTAKKLVQVLRHTGFEPLALRSNYVSWRLPTGRWLRSRAWARLMPAVGGSLVVSARKPRSHDSG